MSKIKSLRSRYCGTLIGCLCGDAYGALFEHNYNNNDARIVMQHINKYRLSESAVLRHTDDSSMTKSTCMSLIKNNGFNAKHMAQIYSDMYFEDPQRGYGEAVRKVFKQLADTHFEDPYGPASKQFNGKGSFGNGAAMRVSGLALFSYQKDMNADETVDLIEDCSKITHSNPNAILGAVLVAFAIKYVIPIEYDTFNETDFLRYLVCQMEKLEADSEDKVYTRKLKQIQDVLENLSVKGADVTQSQIVSMLGNDVSAAGSVPLAIFSFLRGVSKFTDSYQIDNEFVRTLHWAISCGGDTDTIGSMACAMVGAYLGIERIPEDLFKKCEDWEEMIVLGDKLANLT